MQIILVLFAEFLKYLFCLDTNKMKVNLRLNKKITIFEIDHFVWSCKLSTFWIFKIWLDSYNKSKLRYFHESIFTTSCNYWHKWVIIIFDWRSRYCEYSLFCLNYWIAIYEKHDYRSDYQISIYFKAILYLSMNMIIIPGIGLSHLGTLSNELANDYF